VLVRVGAVRGDVDAHRLGGGRGGWAAAPGRLTGIARDDLDVDRLGRVGAVLPQGAYRVSAKTPDGRTVTADVQVGGASGMQTVALK